MNGAREFAAYFTTGQYGKLYIVSGRHARGKTFHIYVLPEGEEAKPNGDCNPPLNDNAVEVYGVISGNAGWTESYGWIHTGAWKEDFLELYRQKVSEADIFFEKQAQSILKKQQDEKNHQIDLLSKY